MKLTEAISSLLKTAKLIQNIVENGLTPLDFGSAQRKNWIMKLTEAIS